MTLEMIHITVDCADAARLAGFWAEALGWNVSPDSDEEYAAVGGPQRPADTPGWLFFQVPEGKSAKNRLHVDLEADDLDAETERLRTLGASVLWEKDEWGTRWNALTDPEGNEFCVAQKKPPRELVADA